MLLHDAAAAGNTERIKRLLREKRVNINAIDRHGKSALHCACLFKQHNVVQCLLARGADASISDRKGQTALLIACRLGFAKLVSLILKAPTCPRWAHDTQGRCAVYWACWSGDVNTVIAVEALLDNWHPTAAFDFCERISRWSPPEKYAEVLEYMGCHGGYTNHWGQGISDGDCNDDELEEEADEVQQVGAAGKECCVCFDSGSNVISCSSDHNMCADCLEGYAAAEAEVGKQRIAANDGKLCCPSDGCKAVFEHQSLAQHLPQAAFTKLLAAWKSCIELKAVNEAAEQARAAAALQAAQSGVAKARAHIIDTILTLQCPRCTKAFDSFEGCFALLCRDSEGHGCGAAFCAYCLHDCGRDAHAHVAVCAHNTAPRKEVFGTVHMFEAVQRARRQQLVQQYLQTLPARLRELVQRATVQDLRDL
eukprot:20289-Heterococcus_DN1.PRE.1